MKRGAFLLLLWLCGCGWAGVPGGTAPPADFTIDAFPADFSNTSTVPGARARRTSVRVSGRKLFVDGLPFTVRGVGYSPVPICGDPDQAPYGDYLTGEYADIYRRDLQWMRDLGANTVRLWGWDNAADHTDFLDVAYNDGDDPIYVIVSFWMSPDLYPGSLCDVEVRGRIASDFRVMVEAAKDHPAVLMWCIGNELNAPWSYGDDPCLGILLNELAYVAHAAEGDAHHPVTTPIMDNLSDGAPIAVVEALQAQAPALDVWGVNSYRGRSFGTLFDDYAAASGKPLVVLEFGVDAFDHQQGGEYEHLGIPHQAEYAVSLWGEIAARADVCAGGCLMAYRDEWWKAGASLDDGTRCLFSACVHGSCGYESPAHPDGYSNEAWYGLMRAVPGLWGSEILEPRAAYFRMQEVWSGI